MQVPQPFLKLWAAHPHFTPVRDYGRASTPLERATMAKRKTIDGELGEERVTRRSTRVKSVKEELVDEEKIVEKVKAKDTVKTKAAAVKKSPIKDEEIGSKEEVKKTETLPAKTNGTAPSAPGERQYWLLKAEPESRLEKGHDVKFSIDDLAAKTVPEPWDGIRSYAGMHPPWSSGLGEENDDEGKTD
ncbi:hypothetical protein V501_04920 [Pseudogymnoascus sp. VKM F-4519 (FW-2642)]|nr:hypothetical protein V501_04920 [Pseudogymnoascus sp. VKM F-4519 (FW-2642)]